MMKPFMHMSLAPKFWGLLCVPLWIQASAEAQQQPVDFSHEVVPVLRKHCSKCHAGESKKGGFTFNTRAELISGSENGAVLEVGKSNDSRLIEVLLSEVDGERMPPEGPRLAKEEIDLLKRWIDGGVAWDDGFAFKAGAYEPPLRPRTPELPASRDGRKHPIDRVIDKYLDDNKAATPAPVSNAAFARRVSLDLIGLLPEPKKLEAFLDTDSPNSRAALIDSLLADDEAYAEHWLTFWNDLLRNDYGGTGFITGGRKQISGWLYSALLNNKPYDKFVQELIAPPNDESSGFIDGIKWRGEVSAGQTVEIQFAQSVSQSLLGINMKCASCHDSFIDRWKLDEAYGLAAIYSNRELEIYRCDKSTGRIAKAKWLFPELGEIDASAPQSERLKQLAGLMTHPENGRFARTIVNRLWHRMMGHGIVHPTDSMQTEPWNADLLDLLASDFVKNGYDIKHTLRFIANSAAYQSRAEVLSMESDTQAYHYHGPRAKRMTAEQFMDTVWQLTGAAPSAMDASFARGKVDPNVVKETDLTAKWIWSSDDKTVAHAAGEKRTFRKRFKLDKAPGIAVAVVTCDNRFSLFLNGKKIANGDNWDTPVSVALSGLVVGENELLVVGENQGSTPNPAGLLVESKIWSANGDPLRDKPLLNLVSDTGWEWSDVVAGDDGKFPAVPSNWKPAVAVANQQTWAAVLPKFRTEIVRSVQGKVKPIRASLLKSDPLMRTLGRPNRDQIVSMRPNELTTLEAMEFSNGSILATTLARGAENLLNRKWKDGEELTRWLYRYSLSRDPSSDELAVAKELVGRELSARGIEDLLWVVIMLPEFQLVR